MGPADRPCVVDRSRHSGDGEERRCGGPACGDHSRRWCARPREALEQPPGGLAAAVLGEEQAPCAPLLGGTADRCGRRRTLAGGSGTGIALWPAWWPSPARTRRRRRCARRSTRSRRICRGARAPGRDYRATASPRVSGSVLMATRAPSRGCRGSVREPPTAEPRRLSGACGPRPVRPELRAGLGRFDHQQRHTPERRYPEPFAGAQGSCVERDLQKRHVQHCHERAEGDERPRNHVRVAEYPDLQQATV